MSPRIPDSGSPWVPLRATMLLDPAILAVGNMAELAYYRSLQVAKLVNDDGRLHRSQLVPVVRALRGRTDIEHALLEHNLWVSCSDSAYVVVQQSRRPTTSSALSVHNEIEEPMVSDRALPKRDPVQGPPRARSSLRKRREKEEPFRSPSGPDRNGSARTEPRVAGGAARPAPTTGVSDVDDLDDGGTVIGLGQLRGAELAKANVRKTRSTGRDVQFRKPEWQQQRNAPTGFETAMAEIAKRLPPSDEDIDAE